MDRTPFAFASVQSKDSILPIFSSPTFSDPDVPSESVVEFSKSFETTFFIVWLNLKIARNNDMTKIRRRKDTT